MATMQFASEPFTDKKLSRLVIGTLGKIYEEGFEQHCAFLDTAVRLGYTTIDTALAYNSEYTIGEWMKKRGNREKIFLITKGAHPSMRRTRVNTFDIEADLHDSLANLSTDYIDLYLLHRDDESKPVGEIVDLLNRFCDEGKIRAFGASNWTAARIAEANTYAEAHHMRPFVASSPNYSLAEQIAEPWAPGCVTISGPAEEAQREYYQRPGCRSLPTPAWRGA